MTPNALKTLSDLINQTNGGGSDNKKAKSAPVKKPKVPPAGTKAVIKSAPQVKVTKRQRYIDMMERLPDEIKATIKTTVEDANYTKLYNHVYMELIVYDLIHARITRMGTKRYDYDEVDSNESLNSLDYDYHIKRDALERKIEAQEIRDLYEKYQSLYSKIPEKYKLKMKDLKKYVSGKTHYIAITIGLFTEQAGDDLEYETFRQFTPKSFVMKADILTPNKDGYAMYYADHETFLVKPGFITGFAKSNKKALEILIKMIDKISYDQSDDENDEKNTIKYINAYYKDKPNAMIHLHRYYNWAIYGAGR